MHKNKPKMAKKWEKETRKGAKLPTKVKKRKKNTVRRKKKRWLIVVKNKKEKKAGPKPEPVAQPEPEPEPEMVRMVEVPLRIRKSRGGREWFEDADGNKLED